MHDYIILYNILKHARKQLETDFILPSTEIEISNNSVHTYDELVSNFNVNTSKVPTGCTCAAFKDLWFFFFC